MKQEAYQDLEGAYKNTPPDLDNVFLYDYVFHYNIYTHTWAAIPREAYQAYWSESNHPDILRSSKIDTLISLIHKTKGDPKQIEKLIEN